MNATELSQIVVAPEDRTDEVQALLEEAAKDWPEPFWPNTKTIIGRVLHPFGVHTWVRWKQYDPQSKQVLDMNGKVCCWCPKAKLR